VKREKSFEKLGTCDITRLKARLLEQTEEDWNANPSRQRTFTAHADTQTIPLLFDPDYRHESPTRHPKYAEFEPLVKPITDQVFSLLNAEGWFIRVMFTRLKPGGHILPHSDFGYSLGHSRRIHVPLVTNPGAEFRILGETQVLGEGEVWEINNMVDHEVFNKGREHRVHLILDCARCT
jgi:hypothetical protein